MSFGRRTWNREEYAAKAATSPGGQSHLSSLDQEQLKALKDRYTDYNALLVYNLRDINKKTLSANLSQQKKGKQFGFYCDICDLTFKDTLQFINHLNHKSHVVRFENIFNEPLIKDTRDNDLVPLNEVRSQFHKSVSAFIGDTELRSNKRKAAKRVKCEKSDAEIKYQPQSEIGRLMGFTEFGSSKK